MKFHAIKLCALFLPFVLALCVFFTLFSGGAAAKTVGGAMVLSLPGGAEVALRRYLNTFLKSSDFFVPPLTEPDLTPEPESEPAPPPANVAGSVVELTYGSAGAENIFVYRGGAIRNLSAMGQEELALLIDSTPMPFRVERGSKEPQVLIVHTHTTESYNPDESGYYYENDSSRSLDENENMLAVGDAVVKELERLGICAVQARSVHDYPSYNGAYTRSRETVTKWLADYPSVKIVLDLHRDAIEWDDGSRISAVANINGEKAAQIMIVTGCEMEDLPNYEQNLRFAASLQCALARISPELTRPLLFDYRNYNQHLSPGLLLIEIGCHGNSLDQALLSARLLARALSECIKDT